ncbi:retrotransposon ORF1 [Tanacetum coccineum]
MRDENHIRTLGDYSKPSHESYRNTIELPIGNNVVPLWSEDPNQHLKDLLKLVDSLDLNGENRERMRLRLFQFSLRDQASNWLERLPAGSITTWEDLTTRFLAQFFPPERTTKLLQIFYDHVDNTIQKTIDYVAGGRLRKLRPDEAWAAIERLAQYENEGWNDAFVLEDVSIDYENPDIKQLLGIMEHKVDTLMKDTISLMGKSESVFRLATNEIYRPPSEPSHQEEFEHIVMNFVLDQEERTRQLEDYMQAFTDEFMELSSEVTQRLKERIKENENKPRKIIKITRKCARELEVLGGTLPHRNETMEEKVRKFGLSDNEDHQMNYNNLAGRFIHFEDVVDWEFLSNKGLAQYDPLHKGVTFRLGGVEREMPLLEFGWRVVLYSERESRDVVTISGLRNAETVNATHLTHMFWPTIGDGGYNVRNIKAKSIRNPRIKLAHRCITMTITGRKETTNRVTKIDLFYLHCIFREGVICNIPYWLAKYLKSMRDKSVIFEGMFVTRIARSFGLLTNELVSMLNRKTPCHVYRKTSLIKMGVIMELYEGECCWPTTREVAGEGGGNDEEGDGEGGNEGIGGSVDIYRNMSQGDWQVHQARWMDQQDERWERIDAWMGQQDERAHWMYDHTVRQFQHMSTRDNLELHLQIDPFPGFEADYPPYGYQGHMPLGYTYHPYPPQDGSS